MNRAIFDNKPEPASEHHTVTPRRVPSWPITLSLSAIKDRIFFKYHLNNSLTFFFFFLK